MKKTITLTEFRKEPGEHIREVHRQGHSFLLTKSGRPVARLEPTDDVTVIERDGSIRGDVSFLTALAKTRKAEGGY